MSEENGQRKQRLVEALNLRGCVAPNQMKEWILQHNESFAVDDQDLERTDLVKHFRCYSSVYNLSREVSCPKVGLQRP